MYVRERALTFADLAKAVQRDAGLGQTSSIDNLPVGTTSDISDPYSLVSLASDAGISPTPSVTTFNWGLLVAAVAGVFLFAAVAGKK